MGKFEIFRVDSSSVKKPRFRRFGIGTGTKSQQANLRALAKDMAQDPEMLIPRCAGNCSRCPFDKLMVRLRKIQAHRENSAVLKKLASGGKPLERGYASMLILALEETPIMFATAKLPTGDVGYTARGKVKKEILVGLQHFDDPKLRLLAYSEMVLKKKLHLYSLDEEMVCTGLTAAYPPELASEVLANTSYRLRKTANGFGCEHSDEASGLRIKIKSADIEIRICRSCASRKQNLFTELTSRLIARHPEKDFIIRAEHDISCVRGKECTFSGKYPGSEDLFSDYRSGKLSDMSFIDEFRKELVASMGQSGRAIYAIGKTCFEDDMDAFIKALSPSQIEEIALKHILKNVDSPVIMDTATPNAVLALFWDKYGASAINSVVGDKELAKKIFSETRDTGKVPSQILRDAKIQVQSKNALAALPDFRNLSKLGKYADDLARTYKALGKEEALKRLATIQGDTKMKSVGCGFLYAFEALKGKEWQFTKEELDYGKYLADFAKTLLESKAEEYGDALRNLLTAAGSDEAVA